MITADSAVRTGVFTNLVKTKQSMSLRGRGPVGESARSGAVKEVSGWGPREKEQGWGSPVGDCLSPVCSS